MRGIPIVLLLIMAGCATTQTFEPVDSEPVAELPTQWDIEADGCITTAVFFLVDPSQAEGQLPVGFHARDLSGFLYNTPVTAGKVPAFVAASKCDSFNLTADEQRTGALEVVYLGFYIHAPDFSSAYANAPADYNFYAISYLGPTPESGGLTSIPASTVALYEWTAHEAEVDFDVTRPDQGLLPADALVSSGEVRMDGQSVFRFNATAFFPQPFQEPPVLRFWQAAPRGIGFIEFHLPQTVVPAGPLADCHIDPDSVIYEVVGGRDTSPDDELLCGLTETFALLFDEHGLQGRLHHMEGVHPL